MIFLKQLKLDEVSSSEVTAHYHTKRIEQERDLLTQQNTTLTEELSEKTNYLLSYRKEKVCLVKAYVFIQ